MATDILVPTLGESVSEATIGRWFKKPGDAVKADEPLVELETDKVTVEVPSPGAGTLSDILAKQGDTVAIGSVLGALSEGGASAAKAETPKKAAEPAKPAKPNPDEAFAPAAASTPPSPAARKAANDAGIPASEMPTRFDQT